MSRIIDAYADIQRYFYHNQREFVRLLKELPTVNGEPLVDPNDIWLPMEDFDDQLEGQSPTELFQLFKTSSDMEGDKEVNGFNINRRFFRWGDRKLVSSDEEDYSEYIGKEVIDVMLDNYPKLGSIMSDELYELLQKLEEVAKF